MAKRSLSVRNKQALQKANQVDRNNGKNEKKEDYQHKNWSNKGTNRAN
jgi:hypothetical protein